MRRRRRISGAGVVGSALAIAAPCVSGCYTHQCDARAPFDSDGGVLLDDNTFETNAIDGRWLDYQHNAVIRIWYPMDMGRPMSWLEPYIGISDHPNQGGANWTVASGGLAEISTSSTKGFSVKNNTCANYFARFVVHFAPRDAGILADSAGDESAPGDSTTGDAGVD